MSRRLTAAPLVRLAASGALLLAALSAPAARAEPLTPLPAVLHAHTTFSTGDLPLDRLVEEARLRGAEAILLSENYVLRVEYGLWPFRRATRVVREEPSVLARGAERYLALVAEARRRFPDTVIVPGVEVVPRYRWTGSLLTGDLTVHDLQKNLLVFGLRDPEELRRLPSTGNPHLARLTSWSLLEALPGLLVLPGLWLVLVPRRRLRRIGGFTVVERRRRWLPGFLLVGAGLAAVVRAYPFLDDPWSPYRPDGGLAAHQALIDQVDARGGLTVWSFPEARDAREAGLLGLRARVRTEAHADDLIRTFRYTAFGAVYEQAARVAEPGGTWDYLLGKYLTGERSRPVWAVGESGFHGFAGGKRLGGILTVFLVREKSQGALVESFRAGRMYALSRTSAFALTLGAFAVRQRAAEAGSGETLRAAPAEPLEVRVEVAASDGGEHPVRVRLVRNGQVARAWAGQTPFRAVHREPAPDRPASYRLEVRGPAPHQLLSNPVFVRPTGAP